jgi:hypothetical protein
LTTELPNGLAGFNRLYSQYRVKAARRNYSFLLTPDEFKQLTQQSCIYCGKQPSMEERSRSYKYNKAEGVKLNTTPYIYNGIDRKDNSRGYILDNCVPCCKTCNFMKGQLSYAKFLEHIKRIAQYQKEKE